MNVNILVIEENIGAAVSLKNALEAKRHFQVYPFANVSAGIDYTRSNKVDVAILSMHLTDVPGDRLLLAIRTAAPKAVMIASTSDSEMATRATAMGADGLIPRNYLARDLLNVLEQIAPHLINGKAPLPPDESSSTVNKPQTTTAPSSDETVFEKLSAEEPPLPDFKQGGTITTFMMQVTDSELNKLLSSITEVMETADEGDDAAPLPFSPDRDFMDEQETQSDTPAQFILEDVVDETMPLEATPFELYLERIRGHEPDDMVAEPDFITNGMLVEDLTENDPFTATTQASESELEQIQDDTNNTETVTVQSEPIADIDQQPTHTGDAVSIPPEDDPILQQEQETSPTERWNWGDEDVEVSATSDDPRITQMAVSLTQASLESTAEATLLTLNGEIVAYEGELSDEDIEEILQKIESDPTEIKKRQGRVQYLTLTSNGIYYLIYSRRTENDYVLSMVFEGNTGITDIRQQSERIAAALEAVPQMSPEDLMLFSGTADETALQKEEAIVSKGGMRLEAVPALDIGPLTKYTFLWLPRDPEFELNYETTEAIDSGLRVQLMERGWQIEAVEVQSDYVYLVAGVPGDEPPQSIVRNLKKRSAKIAKILSQDIDPDKLWAKSYFILTPGRALNVQEIQQYINFYRM